MTKKNQKIAIIRLVWILTFCSLSFIYLYIKIPSERFTTSHNSSPIPSRVYNSNSDYELKDIQVDFINCSQYNNSSPKDIAFNSSNYLYVGTNTSQIQVYSPNKEFLFSWGSHGKALGQFDNIQDLAISKSGYVYVTEFHNRRIQVFDAVGNFQFSWTVTYQSQNYGFAGIDFDLDGNVYVADPFNDKIYVFTSNGQYLRSWNTDHQGALIFDSYHNCIITGAYGCDTVQKIQIFSLNGTLLDEWNRSGIFIGQFQVVSDLLIDSNHYLYVFDSIINKIDIFLFNETYVASWYMDQIDPYRIGDFGSLTMNNSGYLYIGSPDQSKNIKIIRPIQFPSTIPNHCPFLSYLQIEQSKSDSKPPKQADDNQELSISYQFYDPDGDLESGTVIQWFIDGKRNSFFDGMKSIPADHTHPGEFWNVFVSPSDGILIRSKYENDYVTIRISDVSIYLWTLFSVISVISIWKVIKFNNSLKKPTGEYWIEF